VLDRYYQAAKPEQPDWVVRLTSDCPLIDAELMDKIIDKAIELDVDYCSNTLDPTYPDGMDSEVFKFSALEKAWHEAELNSEKEHVTPYIHKNSSFHNKKPFISYNYANNVSYEKVRLTVDEPVDFEVISEIIGKLGLDKDWKTYADYYLTNDTINALNGNITRNEGYITSLKKD
jgi:spore coat polysaccharide biosynthesis protein SpsF